MATTKLKIYNGALRVCGENKLSSLTENRKPRHLLDSVYDDGGIETCLEEGLWNFATRTRKITYNSGVTPAFGWRRAFDIPSDWVRTVQLSGDPYYNLPLINYHDESDYWYADIDVIYVRYVSNDSSYGMDFSRWPETFNKFVQTWFANEIITDLTDDENKQLAIEKKLGKAKTNARTKDSENQATQFPPPGNWVQSRLKGRGSRRDRGNTGSLIG